MNDIEGRQGKAADGNVCMEGGKGARQRVSEDSFLLRFLFMPPSAAANEGGDRLVRAEQPLLGTQGAMGGMGLRGLQGS